MGPQSSHAARPLTPRQRQRVAYATKLTCVAHLSLCDVCNAHTTFPGEGIESPVAPTAASQKSMRKASIMAAAAEAEGSEKLAQLSEGKRREADERERRELEAELERQREAQEKMEREQAALWRGALWWGASWRGALWWTAHGRQRMVGDCMVRGASWAARRQPLVHSGW